MLGRPAVALTARPFQAECEFEGFDVYSAETRAEAVITPNLRKPETEIRRSGVAPPERLMREGDV